jgi:predicted dienelactone hydrolase
LNWLGGLTLYLATFSIPSAQAAERVYVRYAIFERSISVADLSDYAQTGKPSSALAAYLRLLRPEQRQQLLETLRETVVLDQVTVSQFLDSPIGERLLTGIGRFVLDGTREPSLPALRSALTLAAAEPGGITLVKLLQHFPGREVYLNLDQGLAVFDKLQTLVSQTNAALAAVRRQAQLETAKTLSTAGPSMGSLLQPGSLRWTKLTLQLQDDSPLRRQLTRRSRTYKADIYIPQSPRREPRSVIVISHGLGSNTQAYVYLATHLASLGFIVAVPEHPGSSSQQLHGLVTGQLRDVSDPLEFIDRPLDVKFLLDTLQQRSQTDRLLRGQLNLDEVGVIGQSFGGYTALALAGAKPNFEQLRQACNLQLDQSLNVSLLLQCQALDVPQQNYDFRDPRVKAVIAINPLTSAIFGRQGLQSVRTPVMIMTSGADTITPPLIEQIQPFTWLPMQLTRYLVVMENASHFSTLGESETGSPGFLIPAGLIGPTPELARNYLKALSTAFMQVHLNDQPQFASALTPRAAQTFSHFPMPLSLSRLFSADILAAALQPKPRNRSQSKQSNSPKSTPAILQPSQ